MLLRPSPAQQLGIASVERAGRCPSPLCTLQSLLRKKRSPISETSNTGRDAQNHMNGFMNGFINPTAEFPKNGTVQDCGCDLSSHGVTALAGASHSTGHTHMSSTIWDKITCKAQPCSLSRENLFMRRRKNEAETSLGLIASTSSCPPDKPAHSLPARAAVQRCSTPQFVGLPGTECEWEKPSWLQ